jgi:hypothetical protein
VPRRDTMLGTGHTIRRYFGVQELLLLKFVSASVKPVIIN